MTTPQEQVQDVREWTEADNERVAREFMGWRRGIEVLDDPKSPRDWYRPHGGDWFRAADWFWNPSVYPAHDLQVLERAREVWADGNPSQMFRVIRSLAIYLDTTMESLGYAIAFRYKAGDYSRAVLAVLRSTEGE